MKKNLMMRAASVLLVAVMLTTCAISGTFAKYVTAGPAATDSARVAKWGVTINATGVMFSDSYKDEATTYTAGETGDAITVQANIAGTDIVAPGTEGQLAAISVEGTPEVDTRVTYVADLALAGWEVDGAVYCPIEITVGTETFKVGDVGITTTAELETAVEAAIVAKTADYDTNTNLTAVNDDVQVSWVWDYEGNDDAKDTKLGDAASATIALTITTTITQLN
ncbi:MAG: hypothetical protein IKK26_07045 [Clostridia bacterium]|nr:hypothetical protein [Clostridia bacterium]